MPTPCYIRVCLCSTAKWPERWMLTSLYGWARPYAGSSFGSPIMSKSPMAYTSWHLLARVRTTWTSAFSVIHAHLAWVFGTLLGALGLCSPWISRLLLPASSTLKCSQSCLPSTGLHTIYPSNPALDWLYIQRALTQLTCLTPSTCSHCIILSSSLSLRSYSFLKPT